MEKKSSVSIYISIFALLVSVYTLYINATNFDKSFDRVEKSRLNDNLNKLEEINLQFPFISDPTFIDRWNKEQVYNSDSSIRYGAYCEYLFNLLQNVCDFNQYDKVKIEKFIDIRGLAISNKGWWQKLPQGDTLSLASYPHEFSNLIDSYVK